MSSWERIEVDGSSMRLYVDIPTVGKALDSLPMVLESTGIE